jgi:RND family efflux transporter MFP subunit
MKTLIFLLFCALPVAAEQTASPASSPRPVVSERVNLQSGHRPSYVGTVVSKIEFDLGFPLVGTIAQRAVDLGDLVKKGQLLARLNPEDLDAELRAAVAGVAVATAQLRSAKDAEARAIALKSRGVSSETRLEDAQRALAAAQARLVQNEAAMARAADMRSLAVLEAPQDGVITQVYAESGATLPAGQPILRLAATNEREIVIDLNEIDVAALDIGAGFDALLAANTAITATATLTRIDPVADRSTRTRRLHLTLTNPPGGFRLGALAQVSPTFKGALGIAIKASAVLQTGDQTAVWVVDRATNKVALTQVQLGDRFGPQVRITAGLIAGDEVIIKGIHSLTDGQVVGPSVVTP